MHDIKFRQAVNEELRRGLREGEFPDDMAAQNCYQDADNAEEMAEELHGVSDLPEAPLPHELSESGVAFLDIDEEGEPNERRYLILVIYDISNDRHRVKVAKFLNSYGNRVQKSAFETYLTKKQFNKMLAGLDKLLKPDDNIRIYRLRGYEEVKTFGTKDYQEQEKVTIV